MNRETHTAADAERWVRAMQRDPAAKAYGDHLRRKGFLVERDRSLAEFVQLCRSEVRP